ncbi:MAG: glycoside hydrolase family 88 protein [Opitutae bacterium]|nr:glycoside hydrolase family 88 protein [Opitutae bacterium]
MKSLRFTFGSLAIVAGLLGILCFFTFCTRSVEPAPAGEKFGDATPLEWSQRMARSEMARRGTTLNFGGAPKARWDYTSSLLALSLIKLAERTGDTAMRDYAEMIVSSYIAPDGTIRTYKLEDYNIDMIPPGKVVLLMIERTGEERYRKAAETLRRQLATHPRTSEGGFWHKQRYPHQMWLDGIFMGAPFYAHYGKLFNEPAAFDDAAKQALLIDAHAYDPKTELYYHGWDESRAQSWANKQTGTSPNFWGRGLGWYSMALVDLLDFLPGIHSDVESIHAVLRRVAEGVVRHQDPKTGLWFQVLDQGERKGNYREATASAMFVYALAKAVNRGYLPRDQYLPAIRRGYAGLVRDLIKTDANGQINLTQCCEVAGLGYTTGSGRPRDGSFDYYVSEPIVTNDLKGTGPFILAGIEVERLLTTPPAASVKPVATQATGWQGVPAILARIQAPTFPDRDFPITQYGATAGGTADCTDAIKQAIAACHAAGGGRVVVPAGTFLTGAIHLKSKVNLHIAAGATLLFRTDPAAYLPAVFTRFEGTECMNYSPLIYAFEQENIAVTGAGTLDGGAALDNWWGWTKRGANPAAATASIRRLRELGESATPVAERIFGAGHFLRPNFIQPYRCRNVLIEGVTLLRSPMWEIHPVLCTNVTVRGVTVVSHGPNNDGCNPESSRDVLIENCVFDTGDDCIAIKSGRNGDGRRVATPSENIIVRGCTMKDGHGGVVMGSEISGSCRNVFIENCKMDSPHLDRALRFKSNAQRGGVIENVFMRHVEIGRVAEAILTIDFIYEEGAKGPHKPVVRNVTLDNVTSQASPRVLWIAGFPGATIDRVRFNDCTFRGVETAERMQHAGSIEFRNVTIEPAKKGRSLNSPEAAQ